MARRSFQPVPGLVPQIPSPLNPGARARLEPQVQSIYDHRLITGAQSAEVYFFVEGQVGGRNERDTNIPTFPLPSPMAFLVAGFGVHLVQPAPANAVFAITTISDWNRLLYDGVFLFNVAVQGKGYLMGNLYQFPSGLGQHGFVTTGGATSGNVAHVTSNGVPNAGNYFRIKGAPITISQNESFRGTIKFPAGATSMSSSHTVACILRGVQGKAIG